MNTNITMYALRAFCFFSYFALIAVLGLVMKDVTVLWALLVVNWVKTSIIVLIPIPTSTRVEVVERQAAGDINVGQR